MSKCPGLYFDLGKKARDLLYKDYAPQPPTHFHSGYFKWNFDLSCESPEILPGLTTLFRFIIPDSSKVELRFLRDYLGITAGVGVKAYQQGSFKKGNGYHPFLSFSGEIGSALFSLGAGFAYDVETKAFDEFSAALSFNSNFIISSLNLDDKLDTLKASLYHEFNSLTRTAIAVEMKHNFSSKGTTDIAIGMQHAMFPFALIKARMNNQAKMGAFIQLELWQKLLLAISGEVDCRATNKISKFGFSLALRP